MLGLVMITSQTIFTQRVIRALTNFKTRRESDKLMCLKTLGAAAQRITCSRKMAAVVFSLPVALRLIFRHT